VLLRHVAATEGQSQQALGKAMQIPASRMVALVDELERRGVLERRPSLADRRAHALVLTGEGRRLLDRIMKVSADHMRAFDREVQAPLAPGLVRAATAPLAWLATRRGLERRYPRLSGAAALGPVRPGDGRTASTRPESTRPVAASRSRPPGHPGATRRR